MESQSPRSGTLLSFYPFAAAPAGDFHSADTLHPTDHPGDVSDIIQPLSGGTNSVEQLKIETGLKLLRLWLSPRGSQAGGTTNWSRTLDLTELQVLPRRALSMAELISSSPSLPGGVCVDTKALLTHPGKLLAFHLNPHFSARGSWGDLAQARSFSRDNLWWINTKLLYFTGPASLATTLISASSSEKPISPRAAAETQSFHF